MDFETTNAPLASKQRAATQADIASWLREGVDLEKAGLMLAYLYMNQDHGLPAAPLRMAA